MRFLAIVLMVALVLSLLAVVSCKKASDAGGGEVKAASPTALPQKCGGSAAKYGAQGGSSGAACGSKGGVPRGQ